MSSAPLSKAAVAKAVLPSIVNITTKVVREVEGSDVFPFMFQTPRQVVTEALGSGVILTECGLIVTNDHVVEKAEKIKVITSDEEQFDAEVVIRDFMHDLAIIRIVSDEAAMGQTDADGMDEEMDDENLVRGDDDDDDFFAANAVVRDRRGNKKPPTKRKSSAKSTADVKVSKIGGGGFIPIAIGRAEECVVGDSVLAVGNNLGFHGTVTDGIVSAIGRTNDERLPLTYPQFPLIQTNASINPGSSGGALVNLRGELIGVNESIATSTGGNVGVGFAVPSNFVMPLLRAALKNSFEPERVWDGISVANCPLQTAPTVASAETGECALEEPRGVRVIAVHKDSPAKKAGLKKGDVITHIGKVAISNVNVYYMLITGSAANETQMYRIWRPTVSWLKRLKREKRFDKLSVSKLPYDLATRSKAYRFTPLKVTIEMIPAPTSEPLEIKDRGNPFYGATVCELCPAVSADFGLDYSQKGVIVWELAHGSQASKLGFHPGDIILAIDAKRVRSLKDVEIMADELQYRKSCRIWYKRRGKRRHIDVYLRSARRRGRYARL